MKEHINNIMQSYQTFLVRSTVNGYFNFKLTHFLIIVVFVTRPTSLVSQSV
jgi:hypothetical protein